MGVYQGSRHHGCEVTFYRQSGQGGRVTLADGRNANSARPTLVGCHVQAALGGIASFGLVCRPEQGDTFFPSLQDDDWVDIVMTQNGKRWHVLRGLVDEIRCSRNVGGNGAITTTYQVSGRSFQKIFLDTSVYLNIGQGENIFDDLARTLADQMYGALDEIQPRILYGILEFLSRAGRGAWNLPDGMPNTQGQFFRSMQINTAGITDTLPRVIAVQPLRIDNGNVWSFAQQYSDPMYAEMFCDQVDLGVPTPYDPLGSRGQDIADTQMTVVIRDRPYIAVDPRLGTRVGLNSPWFSLAKGIVDREQIATEDLGRSGKERYNSFNAYQAFDQVFMSNNAAAGFNPFWAPSDMFNHGLRRMDGDTSYSFDTLSAITEQQFDRRRKLLLKDWYCLNTRYFNGTINLGTGAPHLHIGTRLVVPGRVEAETFTGYIEAVSHSWQAPGNARTQISVTRGYYGTDRDHLALLQKTASEDNYKAAQYGF